MFVLCVKGISCLTSYKYTTYLPIILISEKKMPFMLDKNIQILLSLRSNLPQAHAICVSKSHLYIINPIGQRVSCYPRDHSGTTPGPLRDH